MFCQCRLNQVSISIDRIEHFHDRKSAMDPEKSLATGSSSRDALSDARVYE